MAAAEGMTPLEDWPQGLPPLSSIVRELMLLLAAAAAAVEATFSLLTLVVARRHLTGFSTAARYLVERLVTAAAAALTVACLQGMRR